MKRTHIPSVDATAASSHLPWPLLDGVPTQPQPETPATGSRRPARCTRYRWCAETGEHTDHNGAMIAAACEDAYGSRALDMRLFDWGGGIEVAMLDLSHTPAEARIVLAQLRAHLDIVERLIDIAEVGE